MVSKDEFWEIMGEYGSQIWPIQIIVYFLAILLVLWFFFKLGRLQSLFTKLFLSITFAWNGIMFYIILAKGMAGNSRGNYFFGALFILVSILFILHHFSKSPNMEFWKMRFYLPQVSTALFCSENIGDRKR